jgi:transcriptional regulator with XRE-family HTH domain
MESLFMPDRLKKIREKKGLNKAEAARLLGLSKMGYLRYESADRTPSHQTIVFMAQKLGTSPDYLVGTTEDPEPKEYVISKSDDPALFELIADVMDKKSPNRKSLLTYYKKLKALYQK